MRSDQIHSLRQTHQSVSSMARLVTAGLTISGIVLASMERHSNQRRAEEQTAGGNAWGNAWGSATQQPGTFAAYGRPEQAPSQLAYPYAIAPRVTRVVPVVNPVAAPQVIYRPRRLTIFGYLATLLGLVLRVVIGMVAVAAIVAGYFASDPTWRAIELTALILLILYLAERVARARRA